MCRDAVQVHTVKKTCSFGVRQFLARMKLHGKVIHTSEVVAGNVAWSHGVFLFTIDISSFRKWPESNMLFFPGGIFSLRLIFGEHYPEKPPRVRFTSDVFHPNGKFMRTAVWKPWPFFAFSWLEVNLQVSVRLLGWGDLVVNLLWRYPWLDEEVCL